MQPETNIKKRDTFTVLLGQFELKFISRGLGDNYYETVFERGLENTILIGRFLTSTENEMDAGIFSRRSEFGILDPDGRFKKFDSFTLEGCKTAREYGLAILNRANIVRRYYGFEKLAWVEKLEPPSPDPVAVLSELIASLEKIDLQPIQDELVAQAQENIKLASNVLSQLLENASKENEMQPITVATSPALPPGHLLLTPDVIPPSFLEFLEASGIPDPADDLEWILITDVDCIYYESKNRFSNIDARWYLKDDHPIAPLVWRLLAWEESVDWYRIEFADGCKAVGICQH